MDYKKKFFKEEETIGNLHNTNEWFLNKVKEYHGNKVEILSEYHGSERPIDLVYHCNQHGDTYTTINAKNVCKSFFLPCKKCQSIRKSQSHKANVGKSKQYYYDRLVEYCHSRGGSVLEKEWTRAKDTYHFKCGNPEHPIFTTTADALYSGEHWCPYCSGRAGNFEERIKDICDKKNGKLLSDYCGAGQKVRVRCDKHNYVWELVANNLVKGRWCPICNMGFNEKTVYDYLKNMNANFQIQYEFNDLVGKNGELLRFDFALLKENGDLYCLVEVDDEEHRYNTFTDSPRQQQRRNAIERDKAKNQYCKERNILLYRMQVPFNNLRKWSYDDYYRYINTELKDLVIASKQD